MIDGEFTIKRLSIKNNELYLKAENHNYPDFRFKNHIDVQIWELLFIQYIAIYEISNIDAIALIDANNFYASCEQNINPHLRNKPVVILSNNDGCIIARSPEARALKIKMGTPYFKVKERLNKLDVVVLSSNYSLYGDMSRRLMNLLKNYCEEIEIYSIDEAFVSISRPNDKNLYPWARRIRSSIYQNLGITITIGIGENKVRAKLLIN